jgi:hypothetical protein
MTKNHPPAGSREFTHPVHIRGLTPGIGEVANPVKQYQVIENYKFFDSNFRLYLRKAP